jgi:hypothetical protein
MSAARFNQLWRREDRLDRLRKAAFPDAARMMRCIRLAERIRLQMFSEPVEGIGPITGAR